MTITTNTQQKQASQWLTTAHSRPSYQTFRRVIDHRNKYLPRTPIYDHLPEGWRIVKNTLTQPNGTVWISNGAPFQCKREGRKYKHALMWDWGRLEMLEEES